MANSLSAICWLSHPRVWDYTARTALLCLSSKQNEHKSWQVKSSSRPQRLLYKGPGLISGQVYNSFICTVMNSGLSGQEAWAIVTGSTGPGSHLSLDCIVKGGILETKASVLKRLSRLEGEPMHIKEWHFRERLTTLSLMPVNFSRSFKRWQGRWNKLFHRL